MPVAMERPFAPFFNGLLRSLLTLLGFSLAACETTYDQKAYGTPETSYQVRGYILSDGDWAGVSGARIIIRSNEPKFKTDTIYTGETGGFRFEKRLKGYNLDRLHLTIEDVDGAENGEFDKMVFPVGRYWDQYIIALKKNE